MARIHGCNVTSREAMLFMKYEHYGKCKDSFKDSPRKCKYLYIHCRPFVNMSLFRVNILDSIKIIMYKKETYSLIVYQFMAKYKIPLYRKFYFYATMTEKLFDQARLYKIIHRSRSLTDQTGTEQSCLAAPIIQTPWFSWYNSCSNRIDSRGLIVFPTA